MKAKLNSKQAEVVLKNLDLFIKKFELANNTRVTEGARKYIEEILCKTITSEKLN